MSSLGRSQEIVIVAFLVIVAASSTGCGSHTPCTNRGGPVAGPVDSHCADKPAIETNQAACEADAPEAAAEPSTDPETNPYGDTMYNGAGDDDDCKYHITWSVSPVCEQDGITFNITVTSKVDGSPVASAAPRIEAFLSDTHPAPNTLTVTKEGPAGTYSISSVKLDRPGRWTVRFHLFETCADTNEASPHGHAAFFMDVP